MRMSCGACGFDGETAEQDARLAKICEGRPRRRRRRRRAEARQVQEEARQGRGEGGRGRGGGRGNQEEDREVRNAPPSEDGGAGHGERVARSESREGREERR